MRWKLRSGDGRDHPLRAHPADLAADVAPQVEARFEAAVGISEEGDVGDADHLRRGALLGFADLAPSSVAAPIGRSRPASPLVQMQYATSMPASVHRATVPAFPKSTSSGCAVTTRIRSMSSFAGHRPKLVRVS